MAQRWDKAGTVLLADTFPELTNGSIFGPPLPGDFTALDFLAGDGTHGQELFRSDGTEAGTRLIKDINPNGDSVPLEITPYDGRVFFSADEGVHGNELWTSDGTADGTYLFADLNRGDAFWSAVIYGGRRATFLCRDCA